MISTSFSLYKDQIISLFLRELKLKYKNTFLGFFWSILTPLSQMIVLYLVFGIYMRFNIPNYILYLVAGLFLWQSFSNLVFSGLNCFLSNGPLMKKLACPRSVFVWAALFSEIFHLLLTIPMTMLIMVFSGVPFSGNLFLLFPLLFLFILFSSGVIMLVGTIQMLFRDMERLISIFLQLLFYVTPVFYPENIVPEKYAFLMKINPVYCFIKGWRMAFSYEYPDSSWNILLNCTISTVIFVLLGGALYLLKRKKFAEVL